MSIITNPCFLPPSMLHLCLVLTHHNVRVYSRIEIACTKFLPTTTVTLVTFGGHPQVSRLVRVFS